MFFKFALIFYFFINPKQKPAETRAVYCVCFVFSSRLHACVCKRRTPTSSITSVRSGTRGSDPGGIFSSARSTIRIEIGRKFPKGYRAAFPVVPGFAKAGGIMDFSLRGTRQRHLENIPGKSLPPRVCPSRGSLRW